MSWFKKSQENIDDLEQEYEVFPAVDNYTRYVWGTKEQVQQTISSGLKLNSNHDSLLKGWNYLHVGGDEWVAILANDYGRSGPVCEITIFDLPNGFYIIEDPDLTFKGKVDSYMLVSRNSIIPPQCVEITKEFNTEDIEEDFGYENYWEMA